MDIRIYLFIAVQLSSSILMVLSISDTSNDLNYSEEDARNDSLTTPNSHEYKIKSIELLKYPNIKNKTGQRNIFKIYRFGLPPHHHHPP